MHVQFGWFLDCLFASMTSGLLIGLMALVPMVPMTRVMAKPFVGYMLVHCPFWTLLSEFLGCFAGWLLLFSFLMWTGCWNYLCYLSLTVTGAALVGLCPCCLCLCSLFCWYHPCYVLPVWLWFSVWYCGFWVLWWLSGWVGFLVWNFLLPWYCFALCALLPDLFW
jgi:hypothetical protein